MKITIIGPMNSGKGTYASRIAKKFGIPHISTGQIFRENIDAKTELGKEVESFLNKGILVPDEITLSIVKERISKPDCKNGFIFDGFPRTLEQAKQFDKISSFDIAIYLDVPKEVLIKRASGRRTCKNCGEVYNIVTFKPKREGICDSCGGKLIQREDDKPEAIRKRLEEFEKNTKPLLEYYKKQGILKRIVFDDPEAPPEENTKFILKALGVKK
ncbi:MAG: adenylate kinase [Candidatus Aenigmatarchaeota archaeon]